MPCNWIDIPPGMGLDGYTFPSAPRQALPCYSPHQHAASRMNIPAPAVPTDDGHLEVLPQVTPEYIQFFRGRRTESSGYAKPVVP